MKHILRRGVFLLAFTAVACSGGSGIRRGGTGESCRAHNDCASGFACIREVCVPDNSSLDVTGNACFRIECSDAADCCGSFVPDPACATYEAACNADPNDCLAFRQLCQCHRACESNLCVDTSPECLIDAHCPWFDRDLCEAERCVECRVPTDCADTTNACVDGVCVPPCTTDSECALLETCVDSSCVRTGCTTDRECAFLLDTPNARCRGARCEVSCKSDVDCDLDAFEACEAGRCVFVGCATDAECRVVLGIENEMAGVTAACRAP